LFHLFLWILTPGTKISVGEIFQARWNTQLRASAMVPHNTNYTNWQEMR
jgi:hypothetical protein